MLSRPLVATFVVVVLLTAAQPGPASSGQQPATADAPEMIELEIGTGTVLVSQQVLDEAGDRFLTFVEPPVFTRTQEARQNPNLQPGDGGDEGLVITDRRHTDYSYLDKPWTGGMRIENVHGTPTEYLCVCDVEFRMSNESGMDPTRPIRHNFSTHVWFDNITVYGGGITTAFSDYIIISNSKFIDSGGISPLISNHGLVHNITAINQRGPLDVLHNPPDDIVPNPSCFPNTGLPCPQGGVRVSGGQNWTVEWSHFHSGRAVSDGRDTTIQHNTFRQGTPAAWFGDNEISWNLIRDHFRGGINTRDSDSLSFHNNSILAGFKIDTLGISSPPGINIINCPDCNINSNDFLGYGPKRHASGSPFGDTDHAPALLGQFENKIVANDNYWGTYHDPQQPPGVWIDISDDTDLTLDRWETEPIHDITPIMWTLDQDDPPAWAGQLMDFVVEETTGAVPDL